ncbi:hypothetical protein M2432_004928 [Mycobacterium sp. OTB74]|nr:hypothetical protein [Mycobacterium sp. OTB74]
MALVEVSQIPSWTGAGLVNSFEDVMSGGRDD